jgi:hypothetical protein
MVSTPFSIHPRTRMEINNCAWMKKKKEDEEEKIKTLSHIFMLFYANSKWKIARDFPRLNLVEAERAFALFHRSHPLSLDSFLFVTRFPQRFSVNTTKHERISQ